MLQKSLTKKRLGFLGILLVALGFIPYLLLGTGSVITVHDQLDGEIFTYIYQAEYLCSGQRQIMEWMGGIDKTALFPPSALTVLLYALLPAFTAFLSNQFLVAAAAFAGMYLFLCKLIGRKEIAFASALLFAYLPFYSVYGLSVAGIPLLAFAVGELTEKKKVYRNLLLVIGYGLMSSFVLIGYAVVGLLFVYCILLLVQKDRKQYGPVYASAALLTAIYAIFNKDLIFQVLGRGSTVLSHKSEYILHPLPFWETFADMLLHGSGHAPSYHLFILAAAVFLILAGGLCYKRMEIQTQKMYRYLAWVLTALVCIALFYAAFQSQPICELRQYLGGVFVYFQFDRIYWMYPFLWYTVLALELELLVRSGSGKYPKAAVAACFFLCGVCGCIVLWNSDFKRNLRQLAGAETSNAVTWEKYYGEEVFDDIREYIGLPQREYRVGSVGLNPAAAAYNGFYTIDGYSNNYSLAYKHSFRRVIEQELDKDAALKQYFDDWGNRCYLYSAELGQNTYFEEADKAEIERLEWNMDALKELKCDYIFAGAKIKNAQELGLHLENTFRAKRTDCRYAIYLYAVQ